MFLLWEVCYAAKSYFLSRFMLDECVRTTTHAHELFALPGIDAQLAAAGLMAKAVFLTLTEKGV